MQARHDYCAATYSTMCAGEKERFKPEETGDSRIGQPNDRAGSRNVNKQRKKVGNPHRAASRPSTR